MPWTGEDGGVAKGPQRDEMSGSPALLFLRGSEGSV